MSYTLSKLHVKSFFVFDGKRYEVGPLVMNGDFVAAAMKNERPYTTIKDSLVRGILSTTLKEAVMATPLGLKELPMTLWYDVIANMDVYEAIA